MASTVMASAVMTSEPMAPEDKIRGLVRRYVDDALPSLSGEPAPQPSSGTRLALGADHGGYELKEVLRKHLEAQGFEVADCGTHSQASVDYPDIALAVAEKVSQGDCNWGIVIDGAGIGSSMAANKVPGIRAALCYDLSSAKNSREHNHANVLTLGAGLIGSALARQIADTWLATPWGGDRHARRVKIIDDIEKKYLGRNT